MYKACLPVQKYLGSYAEMIYINHAGEITQRKIHILEISGQKVRAYCFKKQAPRWFHVEGILSIWPTNHTVISSFQAKKKEQIKTHEVSCIS